jgi:hypothetical protein
MVIEVKRSIIIKKSFFGGLCVIVVAVQFLVTFPIFFVAFHSEEVLAHLNETEQMMYTIFNQ